MCLFSFTGRLADRCRTICSRDRSGYIRGGRIVDVGGGVTRPEHHRLPGDDRRFGQSLILPAMNASALRSSRRTD